MIGAIIEGIIGGIESILDDIRRSVTKHRKGFKMKLDPIHTNYKYIPIFNKKLLLQNQRRY